MDKKQLKQERIRGYFIEAACEIIENEGITEASVRKVADKAGYHYTTLYAHFDDFNHVVHLAILKFLGRIMEYIDSRIKDLADPLDRYTVAWLAYTEYLLDHRNVARVVVVEPILHVPEELMALVPQNPLVRGQVESLKQCVEAGYIPANDAMDVSGMISFICGGCIADYLSGRKGRTAEESMRLVDLGIKAVLRSIGK